MSNLANPEMITLGRDARGKTQTDLARDVGLTQATLSKLESGAIAITYDHVHKIAAALRFPEAFFYQQQTVRWTGSGCMYHRKRQSLLVSDYRRLLARANILRLAIWRLLSGIEIATENRFFRLDVTDNGSPEQIAEMARNSWNLPPGPIVNLTTAIEAAGGIVLRCHFGLTQLDAFSQWPPGMPPVFFVNASTPPDRARFTLAHEIGHIIMHVVPTPNLEQEADRFAAEFLMPRREIGPDLVRPFSLQKAAHLKSYWRVSMSALIRRAKDLGKISESQYRGLMTQMSGLGYRKVEPVALEAEEPTVVRSVIRLHLEQHGYSIADLSQMAALSEDEFTREFPVAGSPPSPPYLRAVK